MSIAFRLPDVGEGVAEAEIVRWLVDMGDWVERDQAVVEVQTDKAVVELPAPNQGKVTELKWKVGEIVPVGEVLYVLGESVSVEKGDCLTTAIPETSSRKIRVLAAPSTRRVAREFGIILAEVTGTGEHGRVLDEDVRRYAAALERGHEMQPTGSDVERQTHLIAYKEILLTPMRKIIGDRLLASVTKKPHATHFDQLNVESLVAWRKRRLKDHQADSSAPKVGYLPILMKLVATTLKQHELFNAHYDEVSQMTRVYSSISIGIATDTSKGLLVPVIKQVEHKSIRELVIELDEITELAKQGKCTKDQLTGSTFTISNAGSLGGEWATPIINPPEVAILAIHPIAQKPVIIDGELSVGWRMNVSLSFDHRVLDGADAIRFTKALGWYTEDMGRWGLEGV